MVYIIKEENMEEYFHETGEEFSKWKKRIIFYYRKFRKKIYCRDLGNKQYKLVCCQNHKELSSNKQKNIEKHLLIILKSLNKKNIVLDCQLQKDEVLKNFLYANQFNILEGRELLKMTLIKIIEKIGKLKKQKIQKQEISILINQPDQLFYPILKELAQKAKLINIITQEIQTFETIEKQIYEELGVMINVSNNMKKTMNKSDIIINYDFPIERLSQCNFPKLAVIVNVEQKLKIYSIKFQGININDYEIKFSDEQYPNVRYLKKIEKNVLYESFLYDKIQKNQYDACHKQIKEDKMKILYFFGNSGEISKKEFETLQMKEKLKNKMA